MMPQRNDPHSTRDARRSGLQTSASLRLCVKIPHRGPLPNPGPKTRNRAFTLIETALAMLAIGLGLLGLFGLGRLGLHSNKETEHEQRCVLMADAVFETLREYNARFVEEARTNHMQQSWDDLWKNTVSSDNSIPFPPVANMYSSRPSSSSGNLYLRFETQLAPAFKEKDISLEEWNPRYGLFVQDKYNSLVTGTVNLKQATLVIYPDGDTYSSEYRIFHTSLSNPGGLP